MHLESVAVFTRRFLHPLAQTAVPGGKLWLLDIPMNGEGRAAASVYAALVDATHNDDLVRQVLCGPGAALLMPIRIKLSLPVRHPNAQ
jgi:hypothetical protein